MHESRFDSLTRRLGAATSRREILKLLLGGLASVLVAPIVSACSRDESGPTDPTAPDGLTDVGFQDLNEPDAVTLRSQADAHPEFAGLRQHFLDWDFSETESRAYLITEDGRDALRGLVQGLEKADTAERVLLYYGRVPDGRALAHAVAVAADGSFSTGFYLDANGALRSVFPDDTPLSSTVLSDRSSPFALAGAVVAAEIPTNVEIQQSCQPHGDRCCLCYSRCRDIARQRGEDLQYFIGGFCTLQGLAGIALFKINLASVGLGALSTLCTLQTGPAAERQEAETFLNCRIFGCLDICEGCEQQCGRDAMCRPTGQGDFACAELCYVKDPADGRRLFPRNCKPGQVCVDSVRYDTTFCADPDELTEPHEEADPFGCGLGRYMGDYPVSPGGRVTEICCPFEGVDCGPRSNGTWGGCCPSCCVRKRSGSGYGCALFC